METPELVDRAEVSNGKAIVAYSRTEAALASLREKYKGIRYDLTTTAGDKAARAGRLELKTLRTDLEAKRKELKAPALDFGRKIDSEAARLTSEIQALEDPIDAQIRADEKRREDERRAREEAEAARKKVHTDAIGRISKYVELAADLPSERIAAGIAQLEAFNLAGFEEFTAEATETRDRTLAALRTLHIKAKAREEEEARLAAQRIEQERIAAEQAEAAARLKAQQDEIDRQRAELEAREEAQRQEDLAREQRQREEQEALERRQREATAAPAPAADRYLPASEPAQTAANVVPMPTKAPAAGAAPTLRLGEINARLAPLSITADGLAELGFPVAATERAAKLYHEADWPALCDAIVHVVTDAREGQQQAA